MNVQILWFLPLKYEYVLVTLILFDSKLNMNLGLLTKEDIWRRHLCFQETFF